MTPQGLRTLDRRLILLQIKQLDEAGRTRRHIYNDQQTDLLRVELDVKSCWFAFTLKKEQRRLIG